jgi:hypothetical protein
MIRRNILCALAMMGWCAFVVASEPAKKKVEPSAPRPTAKAEKPLVHPAVGDRVVILHERLEATHIVATARPEDLRSKEILVGDGMEVGDVDAFFKSSRVRLAAIPAGTVGVVLDTIEPWTKGNEQRAAKVAIISGPLDGQEWWISDPGLAARKTPEGDRRIERWRRLVESGRRKDALLMPVYVSPEPPAVRKRPGKPRG